MKLRTQDLLLLLGFVTPILLFISYWAAEGFRTPLSQRYSLYVLQDPTLPAAVSVSFVLAAFVGIGSVEESDRHQEFFNQTTRWFFLPIYLTIVLAVLLWYRYDFSFPFPAEGIFLTVGRTLPAALAILLPSLLILSLGLLSLSSERRISLLHSLIILVGAVLIFGGAFLQFVLQGSSSGRFSVGYTGAAATAYVAIILGAGILLYSLGRFVKGQAPSARQEEEKD